ncbi:MAG: hypothetical protein FJY73_03690 [Candidatus Eisenbacteria bacterium]|nr:hypothetical protein [Candidatus Eisenbacteria bacterium]
MKEEVEGTYRLLAILIEFSPDDDPTTTGNGTFGDVMDANEAVYGDSFPELFDIPRDAAYFREQLRYLAQYYEAVSKGKLRIEATVPDTIFTAPEMMAYYGDNEETSRRQSALLRDAVLRADPLVDFSAYDGLFVFHAGAGEETDVLGDSPGDIWTVYLALPDLAAALADSGMEDRFRGIPTDDRTGTGDTFFVAEGVILPESETQDSFGGRPLAQWTLGVAAHMMGRLLGAPSLFDTDADDGTSSQGIGGFGIMGTGLWNSGGILPPHPCAWTKVFFGWEEPLLVERDTTIALPLVARADPRPKILRIPIHEDEYWLVENRYKDENGNGRFDFDDKNGDGILYPFEDSYEGAEFDWSIPAEGSIEGSGIFIWHIDEAKIRESGDFRSRNAVNADPDRKGVDLEEADGIRDLDRRATSLEGFGSPADSWRAGNRTRFGPDTDPSTSTAYGARTGITIEVESPAESVMTLSVAFRERPRGWPVRASGVRVVGPVIPVRSAREGILGFAFAYLDTASGASFGNILGLDGKPLDGWPAELPGGVSFAPSAFSAAADGPIALYFPMVNGSIVRMKMNGVIDPSGAWGDSIAGADGQFLSSAAPEGSLVSLVLRGGETTVFALDPAGTARDSIARLEGRAVGPAALGSGIWAATDAGKLMRVEAGGVPQEIETEGTPSPPILLRHHLRPGPTAGENALVEKAAVASGRSLILSPSGLPGGDLVAADLGATAVGILAAADIDRDGFPEILAGSGDGKLHVRNVTGAPSAGWPLRAGHGPKSDPGDPPIGSPAAGDLDGDGTIEIVFATEHGSIGVADAEGRMLPGFPVAAAGRSPFGVAMTASLDEETTYVLVATERGTFDLLVFGSSAGRIEWSGYANGAGLAGLYRSSPFEPRGGEGLFVDKETFCYPNPVGPGGIARIHYRLREEAEIGARVYGIDGSLVEEFPPSLVPAETGEFVWDTRSVGSGVYVARLEARLRGGGAGPRNPSAPREEVKFVPIAVAR